MTELKWTKEKPTQPGWYWMCLGGRHEPAIFKVFKKGGEMRYVARNGSWSVLSVRPDATWAGPIPEPKDD